MSKLWFKAKKYGWGWTPITWEGWVTILIFVGAIIWNALRLEKFSATQYDYLITFIPETLFLLALLYIICSKKGERPHWSWGNSTKK